MKFHARALAFLFTALLVPVWAAAQAPDLIFHNGKILTVDDDFSSAQAVAVTGQRISAVGSSDDVLATVGPDTRKIDLKGRTMVPGLVDTHRHMYTYSERLYSGLFTPEQLERYPVEWRGVRTKEDVLSQVRGIMERYNFPPGKWVYMTNQVNFMSNEGSPPELARILYDELTQWELDKVTPDNPVLMSMGIPNFNGFLLNGKAMEWVMENGRFWVDDSGRPDGHLEPPASRLVIPFTYNRRPEVLGAIYEKDMKELASMGLTAVSSRMPQDSLEAYQWLESQDKLTYRIGYGVIEAFGNVTDLEIGLKEWAAKIGTGSDKIWITGVGPTAIDGASSRQCTDQKRTGSYTPIDSWFPMGQCHTDIEYRGAVGRSAPIRENYFANWVVGSGREGVRFANTHVAGDRATSNMLNFAEQLQQQYGKDATKNWAFDHCGMVNPKDFERIARLDIMMSCYALISVTRAPGMAEAYGDEIAHTFPSPIKSMLDAGVKVVLESDSDSFLWDDIEIAITRKDRSGKVWGPDERVDRPTALKMITNWAADYFLRGDQIGSIETGKFADLVVLDKDYLTVPADEISELRPQVTVFDGKMVFLHTDFAEEYNLRPAGATISTYEEIIEQRQSRSQW